MPACFYVRWYQIKCLNESLDCTLTSSLTSKRNMKKFYPKSSPVQACRPLQAKFYQKKFKHRQSQSGTNSATMHMNYSGWSKSNFQDLPKNRNPTSTQHIFYSPAVRMSNCVIKDNHFVSLKQMKTTENAANTTCYTN